jgi:hypothetical protein
MQAYAWEPWLPENGPLFFDFFVVEGSVKRTLISSFFLSGDVWLPAGEAGSGFNLQAGLIVSDALGTAVQKFQSVTVDLPAPAEMQDIVQAQLQSVRLQVKEKNTASAISLIGSIASTLNQGVDKGDRRTGMLDDPCAGNVEQECSHFSPCCERKGVKLQLFELLKSANSGLSASIGKVDTVLDALMVISKRPHELDYLAVVGISEFLQERCDELKNLRFDRTDSSSLASKFGTILDILFRATKAIVPNEVRVPRTLRDNHNVDDGMHSGTWSHKARRSITIAEAREGVVALFQLISEISSLSVLKTAPGEPGLVIRTPSFFINTSILDADSFTAPYEVETDIGVHAVLPNNLFSANVKDKRPITRYVEVMNAVFYEDHNPLPGANGPIVVLETRERRQSLSIEFEGALAKAVELKV